MSQPGELAHVQRVHVGGEIFLVRSDAPPETIEAIGAFVDAQLRKAQAALGEFDRFRSCVLAAFHVAGELWEAREERDAARAELEALKERLERLAELLPQED